MKRPALSKLLLLTSPLLFFVVTTFGLIILCGSLLGQLWLTQSPAQLMAGSNSNLFAAKPRILGVSTYRFFFGDARPVILKQFFAKHQAPLSDHAELMVSTADRYNIDWRLVPAIAMCESNGGKKIPEGSANAWGWGASDYDLANKTGNYMLGDWEKSIETVTKGLAENYYHLIDLSDGEIGLDDLWQVMEKYAPPSAAKGGPWSKCVHQYMQELSEFKTPE